ncbi:hypothetical protein DPMN_054074 [Dreissena polymorpha]|uniref:Uncharacterized protein n=1 Tax=Dreissena polymorpha TaxID=45954 RepID=A0A9D4HPE3_DREPO|nr:hypothetical protein DPMN_054074 [Dreissena polymorpha]
MRQRVPSTRFIILKVTCLPGDFIGELNVTFFQITCDSSGQWTNGNYYCEPDETSPNNVASVLGDWCSYIPLSDSTKTLTVNNLIENKRLNQSEAEKECSKRCNGTLMEITENARLNLILPILKST